MQPPTRPLTAEERAAVALADALTAQAAHRVALRYAQLRKTQTLSTPVAGAPPCE